jgi:hypothetical protein
MKLALLALLTLAVPVFGQPANVQISVTRYSNFALYGSLRVRRLPEASTPWKASALPSGPRTWKRTAQQSQNKAPPKEAQLAERTRESGAPGPPGTEIAALTQARADFRETARSVRAASPAASSSTVPGSGVWTSSMRAPGISAPFASRMRLRCVSAWKSFS